MNLRNSRLVGGVIATTLTSLALACDSGPSTPEITLLLSGQTLVKKDPRLRWEDPFGTLRPILYRADVAFTNF